MEKKNLNALDDDSLEAVAGGMEVGEDPGDDFTGETIPFCCTACNTIILIKPGQKEIVCTNPKCKKKYHIDG